MIPSWNKMGVIPPIEGEPSSLNRSPYVVDLPTLIERFAISKKRCFILEGFLKFRAELHNVGIISGFQWINGSFVENVELTSARAPRDIDVVTFYAIPNGESQRQIFDKMGELYDSKYCSENFSVDSYYQALGSPLDDYLVNRVSYWYGLWSHRSADYAWKGFLQVSLDPSADIDAAKILNFKRGEFE